MFQLCTYFDRNYLLQGIALYRSLERQSSPFTLWMLCLDEESYRTAEALRLPNAILITRTELLAATPRLAFAANDRSEVEFFYACTAPLVQYVFDHCDCPEGVAYLDADMYFVNDLESMVPQMRSCDVLLVEHRSLDHALEKEHGRYNVSFVHFSDTESARRCLDWWADQTYASTQLGGGIWGDQRYLDEFDHRFPGVKSVAGGAVGLAPWNLAHYDIQIPEDGVQVEGERLVAYHFARFLFLSPHTFIPIRRNWISRPVVEALYAPYQRTLRNALENVREVNPTFRQSYTRRNLRGLILGLLAGRAFLQLRNRLMRLGIYLPSTAEELRLWWEDRRTWGR